MKQLPTAEEMLKSNYLLIEDDKTCEAHTHLVVKQMQEYAKLHVQAALEMAYQRAEVYNKAKFPGDINYQVEPDSILNAYPLNNIK